MAEIQKSGIRPKTVKNVIFGAGVLYKNFSYGEHYTPTFDKTPQSGKTYYTITGGPTGATNYTKWDGQVFGVGSADIYYEKYTGYGGDKIGATKEGAKVSIIPEYTDVDVDGILVKTEGLTYKTGEKASIEAVVIDLDVKNIAASLNGTINYGTDGTLSSSSSSYVTTKSNILSNDYIQNLALVARRLSDNKLTIIVFKKALCTSGFEIDTKNKETSGCKFVFEAYAEMSDTDVETLPVDIIVEDA